MKKLLFVISILFFVVGCSSGKKTTTSRKSLQFEHTSFDEALAKAKRENKPIFIDFYTTWCGPCKMMEQSVFTDSGIISLYNQNFVNLKIDAEKGEGIELAQKFRVAGFPYLVYLDSDGNMVQKHLGYMSVQMMMQMGKKSMKKS
ncbi:MAG: thioredoxin family protein [Chitinophagales bacterium]